MVENHWMFEYARGLIDPQRALLCYAPPGVNVDTFRPRNEGERNGGYILSVGRFSDPRKNVLLLLEAYALLAATLQPLPRLVLAGTEGPGAGFWRRARELGLEHKISITLGSTNEDIAKLFREASCFVLPSDEEGFGLVVTEAMASGIPIVATRCGGPEDIITDGVEGYLTPRGDPGQLARRIEDIFRNADLAELMGRMGRAKAEAHFEERASGERYINVYRSLLEDRPANCPLPG
jgi:glycosyltransferase involved in cell wall biosynthesis